LTTTISGACIYYWGDREQTRLLRDGVRPWAREAQGAGLADSLWYSRFDAGGPHVIALFATTPEARGALKELLQARIGRFLRASPSGAELSRDEVEARHRACRGRSLCPVHRDGRLAANNSFVLFDQGPDAYPLTLSSGMKAADEFWRRMGALSLWTLEQLAAGQGQLLAIRWLAAVDRALRRRELNAEAYWRLHATTLIPSLAHRLQAEPHAVQASLEGAIGERHREAFGAIWGEPDGEERLGFDVDGTVASIVRGDGRPLDRRFTVLRHVDHGVLLQLGVRVELQVPLVLYAWQRSLSR
jgi:hypothetical protein